MKRSEQLAMIWDTRIAAAKPKEEVFPTWTAATKCACCGKQIFPDTPVIFNSLMPGKVWHVGRENRDPFDEEGDDPNAEYNECLKLFFRS